MSFNGILWAGLFAEDLPKLSDFYQNIVGLRLIQRTDRCAIFDVGAGAQLEIWGGGVASRARKEARQQSIMIGFQVDSLENTINTLRQRGLEADGVIGEYMGTRWVHYVDLEGNRFEFKDLSPARD